MGRRRSANGFTLFEVIVAMAVGSLVVLAAHQLFVVLSDTAARLPAYARIHDDARNRQRYLRQLFAQLESGADSRFRFHGDSASTRFQSWCRSSGGWLEQCAVEVALVSRGDQVSLDVRLPERQFTILTGPPPARIAYLKSSEDGGVWINRWGSDGLSVPPAILVSIGSDSLLLRIGTRG